MDRLERGELEDALVWAEKSRDFRASVGDVDGERIGRWSVFHTLRVMGRFEEALAGLPAEFAELLENIVVIVEEEPTEEDLDILEDGDDPDSELLGIYRGLPLTDRSWDQIAALPDQVAIFRGPILRVVLGPGDGPQVALAALAVYFTTFLPLMVGLRAAPASWFDLVRSYGGGRATELVQIRAAASVPYLVAGLQIAAPAAFLGAMVGEFTGAERGMGVLTIQAMRALDVPATWALAVVASATPMAAYALFGWAGRRLSSAPPSILLATPPPRGRSRIGGLALGILTFGLALAIWQVGMDAAGLSPFFAKRPVDVWAFLVTAPDAAADRATLFAAYLDTMAHAVPGYLAGLANLELYSVAWYTRFLDSLLARFGPVYSK